MGYYLRSIANEYDPHGNYIGNSAEGNRFHGLPEPRGESRVVACSACGSTDRRPHSCGGTVCARCDCGESQWKYR